MHDGGMSATSHFLAFRRILRAGMLIVLCTACAGDADEQGVGLPKNPEDLAAAAERGDSMARLILAEQAIADTLARVAAGELDPSALARVGAAALAEPIEMDTSLLAAPSAPRGTGDAMTLRATARGDSLARAAAVRQAERDAANAGRATADSLRGIVMGPDVAGGAPLSLSTPMSPNPVTLSGMATAELAQLEGMEVVVRGVRTNARDLVVSTFAVRSINGASVADGILQNDNGAWSLQLTGGGRLPLARVPFDLQPYAGSRVWLTTSGPVQHGVISRRR
jgi:hypothetical protein